MHDQESKTGSGISRRDMLKFIGVAAGGAMMYQAMHTLGHAAVSPYKGPMRLEGDPKGASVLILGAGVAGMCAAYELRKAGYTVRILEYREKAGGRCWTLRGGDTYTELGGYAQQCRFDAGQYLDPGPWRIPYHHYAVMDYCRELGVELDPFVQLNYNAYYHSPKAFGGKPQKIRHMIMDIQGHMAELLAKSDSRNGLDEELSKEDREKLLEALKGWGGLDKDYRYAKNIDTSMLRGFDTDPAGGLMPAMEFSTPVGFKDLLDSNFWRFLSGSLLYEFQTPLFQPKGGMDMIAQAFASQLEGIIDFNTKVSRIDQDANGVTVTCADLKTGAEKQVKADWCLCTIPLSILSQIEVRTGKPMKDAIDAVPYATGFKTALQFKRRFWEED